MISKIVPAGGCRRSCKSADKWALLNMRKNLGEMTLVRVRETPVDTTAATFATKPAFWTGRSAAGHLRSASYLQDPMLPKQYGHVDSPTGTKQRPRKTSRSPLKRVRASIGPQQHKLTTKGDAPARQPAEQERPMSVRYIITRGRQEMCAKWPNLGRLSSNFVPRKAQELLYPPSPVSNALGRQRGSNDGHVRELLPKSWMLSQKHQDRLALTPGPSTL